ncbi:MAG: L-seryl-tRNA(Sec) selenium transferase, partial [Dehalococcoidia bacterium]
YSRETVADVVRAQVDRARQRVAQGEPAPSTKELAEAIDAAAEALCEPSLRPVINATGVLIHTNLGRAPLSKAALEAMRRAAQGYSNLEFDLASGERGSRHAHIERLLCRLTGAEAGLAVNNNAAAVMLALNALAHGREVIVSRGEAVEIGGGFRIPDILQQSGAGLVEVGTTNRTYLSDYERAVTDETAAFLKVHPSNFRISGFTHEASLEELVAAGAKRRVAVLHDLGSGCLLETADFGLAHEPTPQESIAAGVDLVFFSGDKLLGGPQAGIIVGKAAHVQAVAAHPLVRALRLDKVTLAALEATLLHYVKGEAAREVPVWRMVAAALPALERRARRWARAVGEGARVEDTSSTIGGGSLPGELLPSRALAIHGAGQMLEATARRLRQGTPPVLARIEHERLLLDPRTVAPEDDRAVAEALRNALAPQGNGAAEPAGEADERTEH